MDYREALLTEFGADIARGTVDVDTDAAQYIACCAERISSGDLSAWDSFTDYLRSRQPVAKTIARHLVAIGYRFLDDELDRLREIKSLRPLNEEERVQTLRDLPRLIDSITKLASKVGVPDT